jgi:chromosome segregation ATPase
MTELLNSLGEFFKSPLGVILLTVLTAVGASTVSRIRARTERAIQIDRAVGESERKTQALMLEREAQSLRLIDDIRNDWVKSQQEISELREKYALVVERNIQLVSDQRTSLEAFTRVTKELDACNADSAKLHADFQTMLDKLDYVQSERDKTQTALDKRNGEYEELDGAYKKRTIEFNKLSDDFARQKVEVERLQSDLWETRRDLNETKERLTTLENKPDTGPLDPAKVPETDPALTEKKE